MADKSARALVGACLYVAIADREVDRDELGVVVERLERHCPGVSRTDARRLVGEVIGQIATQGKSRFLRGISRGIDPNQSRSAVAAAIETAAADGNVDPDEEQRLGDIAAAFGVSDRELREMRRAFDEELAARDAARESLPLRPPPPVPDVASPHR